MGAPKDPEKRAEWLKRLSESGKGKHKGPLSQETKDKIAKTLEGRSLSKETKDKISKSNKEYANTEEGKKKLSDASNKFWSSLSDEQRKEHNAPFQIAGTKAGTGKPHSEEHKRKQGEGTKRWFASLTEEEKIEFLTPFIRSSKQFNSTGSSKMEQEIGEYLRSKNLSFEHQKPIGKYYADFFIASHNLVIEFNGCFWHQCERCGHINGIREVSHEAILEYDKKRIEFFESQGYKVKIIWEHDIEKIREQMKKQ